MKFITIATLSALVLASTASADIINVPGDYPLISQAVDASTPGDTIMVDAGTYVENINIGPTDPPLTIIGATNKDGSPAVTIQSDLNGFGIKCDRLYGWPTRVENLIFTGGTASDGGGAWIYNCFDLEFRNCVFTGNTVDYSGGGVYVSELFAEPGVRFVDCDITNNFAGNTGGGVYVVNCSLPLLFDNCNISDNAADGGGGICIVNGRVELVDCTVQGNTASHGGGISINIGWNTQDVVLLTGSTVASNTAYLGGGLAVHDGSVVGGTFVNNTAHYGGGIWLEDADPTLTGVVVQDNQALNNGGGIYTSNEGYYPDVIASTICGNTPNQVWHIEGDNTNIINESCSSNPAACCVNGACIMVEPLMCDDVGGTLSNGGEEDCSSAECAEPCLGDVNNDSEINVNDLLTVIANWGGCP